MHAFTAAWMGPGRNTLTYVNILMHCTKHLLTIMMVSYACNRNELPTHVGLHAVLNLCPQCPEGVCMHTVCMHSHAYHA